MLSQSNGQPANQAERGELSPCCIIFTDLDGTLLDHMTYSWEAARPALELCKLKRVPVVLVSSKTRAEMEPLHAEMGLSAPYVIENGGAVVFSAGGAPPPGDAEPLNGGWVWRLGEPYPELTKALQEIARELGLGLRGFSLMELDEIAHLTGLPQEAARLAAMREYDEPFVLEAGSTADEAAIEEAAHERGLRVVVGGRFYHLQGCNDKGEAVRRLLRHYRRANPRVPAVCLGDSPNDFSMLEVADYPVLVRSSKDYSYLQERIPNLLITGQVGPSGWNTAVEGLLADLKEE